MIAVVRICGFFFSVSILDLLAPTQSSRLPAMDKSMDLLCPIGCEIFENPVKAEDGITYSRAQIEAWFKSCQDRGLPVVSPMTRATMGKKLEVDEEASEDVKKWLQKNPNANYAGDFPVAGTLLRWWQNTPTSEFSRNVDMRTILSGTPSIHDLRKIFATLDELRPILLESLKGWQPPQIVVVGQESSGKSSILERLAMMPLFPRDTHICTRLPIHVRLRYSEVSKPATLAVFNKRTQKEEEGPYVIPTSTGAVDVRDKMEEILSKEKKGALSTDKAIILTVNSPNVASIDLVDMPGLVTLPPENREASRKLLVDHIKEHGSYSMFLASVPASSAPNTSLAMQLVEEHGLQNKTVGVFTMCDETAKVPRNWNTFLGRLNNTSEENGSVTLSPHGWVAVVNAEVEKERTASRFARLCLQATDEQKFLQRKMRTHVQQGRAGCGALVEKVNRMFVDFVSEKWVPETLKKLDEAIAKAKMDNALLGSPYFHKIDHKSAAKARELAAAEARTMISEGSPRLVQKCCTTVLKRVRDQLSSTASQHLQRVSADEAAGAWAEQRQAVDAVCAAAIEEWGSFWATAMKAVLEKRSDLADPGAQQLVARPRVELWRFPAFISKTLQRLEAAVDNSKDAVGDSIDCCLEAYYCEMSPFAKVSCDFSTAPPTVSITGEHLQLVDNIMLCFLQASSALMSDALPDSLASIAAEVAPKDWVESCAMERAALLAKIETLDKAKQRISSMASQVSP